MAKKAPQKSLDKWTKQKWRTKSGKPSSETGERYLPSKAIESLSSSEYAATTRAKREGTAKGKQHVPQPESIAKKTRKFRAAEGGLAMMYGKKKEDTKGMGMKKGGMAMKKKGYAKGGMVAAGASNPATQKRTPKK